MGSKHIVCSYGTHTAVTSNLIRPNAYAFFGVLYNRLLSIFACRRPALGEGKMPSILGWRPLVSCSKVIVQKMRSLTPLPAPMSRSARPVSP